MSLTNSFEIKSFASSEMSAKDSSLKSNSALVILLYVCESLSPINGDRPESLSDTIEKS